MEMKKYKLGEIAEIYNGSTPSTKEFDNYDGNIVWATPKDLSDQNSKYFYQGARNITQKGFDSCSTQLIPANNILMSSRAPIGLFAINKVDCCTNQGFKNIVLDKKIADVDFMYYFLKYHVKEIEALGSGTTFKEVSKTSFEKYEISIPSLDNQQKIASVLSSLDDKIALNRRMNAKLEQMAKHLYDHWFVQFDFPNADGKPYKSSGGKMEYNEVLKREIPAGWEVIQIKDIATLERGISYSKENLVDAGTPMISLASFSPDSSYKENCIKYYQGDIDSCDYLNPYDVLMCTTQQTDIDNVTDIIGKLLFLMFFREQAVFTTDLVKVKVEQNLGLIISCETKLPWYNKYITGFASGTSIKHLNTAGFLNYSIALPKDVDIINKFANIILNFKKQQSVIMKETQKLTALRDRLLPLLMNGQVEVK